MAIFAVIVFYSVTPTIAQNENLTKTDDLGRRCSLRTLERGYGYNFSGTFLVSPTMPVPLASVGQMTFDGRGNVSGYDTNSFGGSVSSINNNAFSGFLNQALVPLSFLPDIRIRFC